MIDTVVSVPTMVLASCKQGLVPIVWKWTSSVLWDSHLKGMVTETCDSHERGFKSGKAINEEREKESKKVLIEDRKIDLDEQIRLHNIDGFERKKIAYWVGFPFPSCCFPFLPQLSPPSTLYSQNWLSSATSDHHSCT
ncbi:hypothetical protein POTOM_007305 [Populus tomentosa]|uniref:Uncharacterized protein n=1 Tax=Populus tomentosa TaxID=118781 RepID=A0A8X8DB46_POPTO|nr:hypothetical protein POTOM_007305 [Populus tomentosa]